jgi:DNA-binding CsgD family transcriptional regulator
VELKEMFSGEITPRQLAILRRFVEGLTYDEIAEELKLTSRGVRWNIDQIVEKGGFSNKHELLAAVLNSKLIVTTLLDGEE